MSVKLTKKEKTHMDYYEIEEELAMQSVLYKPNPGSKEIAKLRVWFKVEVISKDQIKITYK